MLGMYVHVPFCGKICDYCDFSAISVPERYYLEYLDLVSEEIRTFAERCPGAFEKVDTLYVGGGTPSVLSPEQLSRLFGMFQSVGVPLKKLRETTVEFNPESCDVERVSAVREHGATRVSLGIQTFDGNLLDRIGRSHRAGTGEAALDMLLHLPGLRVSADLMFNLPGQTVEGFLQDIEKLVAFGPGHISFYGLKVDPETRLGHRIARGDDSVDEDLYAPMYRSGVEFLERHGFTRYETSNFARAGEESLHNLNYWRRGEYLAFGPGAHGFWGGVRFHAPEKYAPWRNYVKSGCLKEFLYLDPVGPEEELAEIIQLSFRTKEGLDLADLHKCGKTIPDAVVSQWEKKGFLTQNNGRLALSGDGWLFMDRVVEDLFCNCVPYSNLE